MRFEPKNLYTIYHMLEIVSKEIHFRNIPHSQTEIMRTILIWFCDAFIHIYYNGRISSMHSEIYVK